MICCDGRECDGCYDCVPVHKVCRICGRPIGLHERVTETERGPVCSAVDCRFEAALEESDDDMIRDYIETDKNSYINYVFH